MLVSELKRIRKNTDLLIDETMRQSDKPLAGLFGAVDSDALVLLASTVLSYFGLDDSAFPDCAERTLYSRSMS